MKKKLLSLLLLIVMFFGIVPTSIFNAVYEEPKTVEAVDHTGGYIYFLKPSTWTASKVMMFIGHNSYTSVYDMTKVSNTDNLYRYTMPSWGGATYIAFANAASLWGSGSWGPDNRKNAPHYTNVYNNYKFNSGSYYVWKPSGTGNNAGISVANNNYGLAGTNLTTKANVYSSSHSAMSTYNSNANAGTVSVSGYYMSNSSTASSRSKVSSTSALTYASTTLAIGSTATFEATVKEGYEFIGWSTSDKEANIVSSDTKYTYSFDITYGSKTMYALFKPKSYTITLDPGDNCSVDKSSVPVIYQGSYSLPTPTNPDKSYIFTGWYTENNELFSNNGTYTKTSSISLHAKWEQLDSCTVTLISFGEIIKTFTAFENNLYTLNNEADVLNSLSKKGYIFKGWWTAETGGTEIKPEETKVPNNPSNHSLYAHWEATNYKIKYNGLEGATDVPSNNSYTIETETFEILKPFKEYYTFLGWSGTGINGYTNTITINKGSTGDREFTANWEQKVTIYFDFSGVKNWYGDGDGNAKTESSKAYYPFIYFYSGNNSIGWSYSDSTHQVDSYTLFEDLGNNLFKYEIDFLDAKLANLQEIETFIFGFYYDYDDNSQTHQNPLQTENISFPISYRDNGKEYRVIYDDITASDWNQSSRLINFTIGEVVNVQYFNGNELMLQEEPIRDRRLTYNSGTYFQEKEGYKLEGWYTEEGNRFSKDYDLTTASGDLKLYANYVEAHDYYIYVDAKDMNWDKTHFYVYKWNEYFRNHNNSWPGVQTDITYLENGIYKVFVDAEKSFDKLIFCDTSAYDFTNNTGDVPQTEDIIMSPLNSYYIISPETTTNSMGKTVYKIIYEQSLTNFLNAQKNLSYEDGSAFRFACGLQNYTDLVKSGKEFGFKFIFIKDNQSYVGYWNFDPNNKLDCIRYVDELYEAGVEINGNTYTGFYALTLTDSITFNYDNYDQIIVVGCYRDKDGTTQVIKAVEFNILSSGDDIYLYELER